MAGADLPDPARASAGAVRGVRDDVSDRAQLLLHQLLARPEHGDGHRDDGVLRLLGDPLRSRVVELLSSEALCTPHLVEMTAGVRTNVRNQLELLRDADLVLAEPCGRCAYDVLRPEPLRRLPEQLAARAGAAEADLPRRTCP